MNLNLYEFQKVRQINSSTGRSYETPSGEFYPSITTVIGAMKDSSGLDEWKKNVGEKEAFEVMQRAARRGSEMHRLCEEYVLGQEIVPSKNILASEGFRSLKPIIDQNVTEINGSEFPVYSHKLKTAGTCDLLCKWKGEQTVLDFKTSNNPKREEWIEGYFIQCTVYAMCLFELYGIIVKKIVVAIAVDNDLPQIYEKSPGDYIPRAIKMFRDYHKGIRAG